MALCKSVITSIITKLVQKESPQEMAVYSVICSRKGCYSYQSGAEVNDIGNNFLGLKPCTIGKDDLADGLRVLYLKDELFYEGTVKAIQPPDV